MRALYFLLSIGIFAGLPLYLDFAPKAEPAPSTRPPIEANDTMSIPPG